MKSHLQSYPCPLQINSFWNLGFLLGITIILQIITGIFLSLHYTSDLNSAYSSIFFLSWSLYLFYPLIFYVDDHQQEKREEITRGSEGIERKSRAKERKKEANRPAKRMLMPDQA